MKSDGGFYGKGEERILYGKEHRRARRAFGICHRFAGSGTDDPLAAAAFDMAVVKRDVRRRSG